MIRDRNNARLAGFYRSVAALLLKKRSATLAEIEALTKHKEMAFSWLQWEDGKQWFMSVGGIPREYRLRAHLQQSTLAELIKMINDYYDDNKDRAGKD